MAIADYRLRLFQSADLAGSTAFKNGEGLKRDGADPFPKWIKSIRQFYREFPILVKQEYNRFSVSGRGASEFGDIPELWKSVGDELILCARIKNLEHLCCCMHSFRHALKMYGQLLDNDGKHMDVKGAAWIAPFPAPNITIGPKLSPALSGRTTEDLEIDADKHPSNYEFLGKDIDTGFRVAHHAMPDRFVCSIELAWLLSQAHLSDYITGEFDYHDKHILRGVLNDRPYPIFSLYVERSPARVELRSYESSLHPPRTVAATPLKNYCAAFMKELDIELPVLGYDGTILSLAELPLSYRKYRDAELVTAEEENERSKIDEEAGNSPEDGSEQQIPQEVVAQAEQQVKESNPPEEGSA